MITYKPGEVLKKRWKIVERLGEGEHGVTFKASDNAALLQRFCVIKTPKGPARAIKELEAESSAAGLLYHKNIVPVLAFEGEEGFLVQEFVDGESLQDLLRRCAKQGQWPTVEEATSILTQCLEGLEYAHEKKRIHGDLKPGNILLQKAGEARLTDFGVSRWVTSVGGVSGAPPWDPSRSASVTFGAPEVLRDQLYSVQSDLFSVGILAYLLFTGVHPFSHSSGLWTIRERILDTSVEVTFPTSVRPQLDSRIEQIVLRLLKRDPRDRYQTTRELLDDILGRGPVSNACAYCSRENPPEAKYCNKCGKPMPDFEEADEPSKQVYLILDLFKAGEAALAIRRAEDLLRKQPDQGRGWAILSFMLNNQRRYEEGINAADKGIQVSPDFPGAYRNKGFALSCLGKYDEAIKYFDIALTKEKRPEARAQILTSKAQALKHAGKLKDAEKTVRNALEEDPGNRKARALLMTILATSEYTAECRDAQ